MDDKDGESKLGAEPVGSMPSKGRRRWILVTAAFLVPFGLVWGGNYFFVHRPVSEALEADERNGGFSLSAHYRFYVDPSTLVLDLDDITSAASIDLFRGLFQSAAAMTAADRKFDRVVLARSGQPIFIIGGEDFNRLGLEFTAGQNPVFLIRTLAEKLLNPTGESAFGQWEGGWLGVMGKQMEDANEAGRRWAGGQ
jgi:hypothetical protein